ncbi:MAG: hypothetical protein FWG90_09045 [Oscillospiraceae bacterium]|nr:hypothetical protein [Oscillospiraceae bacterium]
MKAAKKSGSLSYNDSTVLFFSILFLIGVLFGTILYRLNSESADKLSELAGSFIAGRLEQTFWQTLVNSFAGAFILLLVCFVLGFGAIFQPLEAMIPVFRGIGLGVSLAGMYSRYGAGGVGISLVLIVPNGVISALVLIIGVREAMRMSNSIGAIVFTRKSGFEPVDYKLYFTKFIVLTAILTVSSLADSLLTFLFAGFWTRIIFNN